VGAAVGSLLDAARATRYVELILAAIRAQVVP